MSSIKLLVVAQGTFSDTCLICGSIYLLLLKIGSLDNAIRLFSLA